MKERQQARGRRRELLGALAARIEAAEDGTVIDAPPLPVWVKAQGAQPAIRGAAILQDYSVQAWAELTFPSRRIRVHSGRDDPPVAASDEVVVLLAERLAGYQL